MKTTILGGLLFLVPLTVMFLILAKIFQFSLAVAGPVESIIPIKSFAGVAFINFVAIAIILIVCYLAGLAARRGLLGARMDKIDGLLIDVVPGYAVAKGMIGSVANEDDIAQLMKPVLVRFDDYDQVAFEVESDAEKSVLFLPGAPSAWSGSTVIVDKSRVRPLNGQTHQTVKLMRVLGRGSLKFAQLPKSEQ